MLSSSDYEEKGHLPSFRHLPLMEGGLSLFKTAESARCSCLRTGMKGGRPGSRPCRSSNGRLREGDGWRPPSPERPRAAAVLTRRASAWETHPCR
jgi:hypothetical protein